jgi:hypothetical protein
MPNCRETLHYVTAVPTKINNPLNILTTNHVVLIKYTLLSDITKGAGIYFGS